MKVSEFKTKVRDMINTEEYEDVLAYILTEFVSERARKRMIVETISHKVALVDGRLEYWTKRYTNNRVSAYPEPLRLGHFVEQLLAFKAIEPNKRPELQLLGQELSFLGILERIENIATNHNATHNKEYGNLFVTYDRYGYISISEKNENGNYYRLGSISTLDDLQMIKIKDVEINIQELQAEYEVHKEDSMKETLLNTFKEFGVKALSGEQGMVMVITRLQEIKNRWNSYHACKELLLGGENNV